MPCLNQGGSDAAAQISDKTPVDIDALFIIYKLGVAKTLVNGE